jgi:hypothetical protein
VRAYCVTCNSCRAYVEIQTSSVQPGVTEPAALIGWHVVSVETLHPAPERADAETHVARALRAMARGMERADEPEMAQAYEGIAASAEASPPPEPAPVRLRLEADLCPKCAPSLLAKLSAVLVSS